MRAPPGVIRYNFNARFLRWFVTEAERAGQPDSIIAEVVGHEEARTSITLSVYSGGPSMQQKRACVEAVSIPHAVNGGSPIAAGEVR